MNTLFPNIHHGIFLKRRNRFIVECEIGGKLINAYLPNPGRMWELLFPGRLLYLVPNRADQSTPFTVVAVERDGRAVMLHTHANNTVAGQLLAAGRIPGLEDARVVRPEVKFGNHRFDFMLEVDGQPFLLEVKSCTLFEGQVAMFPDAITERGRKHLAALAELSRQGMACGVLFLVHWPKARYFLPDYHTDFEFARTFCSVRQDILVKPVAIEWQADLTVGADVRELSVPWDMLAREVQDSGTYIIILHLAEDRTITVGSLGKIFFPAGYYLYVGTAAKNLLARMKRHLRKRKKFHWHIDYLRDQAEGCTALAIRTSSKLEHEVARAVSQLADWQVPRFGSSDCDCETHLFGMASNPLANEKFIALLQYFRMGRLEKELVLGQ